MRQSGGRWMGTPARLPRDGRRLRRAEHPLQRAAALRHLPGRRRRSCPIGPQCLDPSSRACPRRIATLDRQYVYRDCHPGAVYELTDRRLYRVTALDDAQRVVRVQELPETSLERTFVEADLTMDLGQAR